MYCDGRPSPLPAGSRQSAGAMAQTDQIAKLPTNHVFIWIFLNNERAIYFIHSLVIAYDVIVNCILLSIFFNSYLYA